jgi:hypothetical protein
VNKVRYHGETSCGVSKCSASYASQLLSHLLHKTSSCLRRATYGWAMSRGVRRRSALCTEFNSVEGRPCQGSFVTTAWRVLILRMDIKRVAANRFNIRLWDSEEPVPRIIHDLGYLKVFARWRRPFYTGLSQQMKPGFHILNRGQKGAEQGMVPTGHTCICFSLAQGCRSGLRVCGKTGFGDKLVTWIVLFSWF